MRGFYEQGPLPKLETDPKKIRAAYHKLTKRQLELHKRALARIKAEDPRNASQAPTDIDEHKVIAGLKDAVKKTKVIKVSLPEKKLRKVVDDVMEGLKALSKKRKARK